MRHGPELAGAHRRADAAPRHRILVLHRGRSRSNTYHLELGGDPSAPKFRLHRRIHCVTSWSKLGISFTGVSVDTLLEAAIQLAAATHVLAYSHTGYTTNVPVPDVTRGHTWVVWEVDGQLLPREHGGPARLVVPHLYFWKSAKWIAGLRLLDHDEPGFWEVQRVSQLRRSLARTEVRR